MVKATRRTLSFFRIDPRILSSRSMSIWIKRPDISVMFGGDKNPAKKPEVKEKMRKAKEGRYVGELNPNWRGGIAYLPYCSKFNQILRERIRERDNRTCQLCGGKENGRKLYVHHIHYDKENCNPDLVSLCHRVIVR